MGEEGQQKLLNARVLCIGAGGLGSPTALYLAAAGVGTLGIVDNDKADLSNLQRQILHSEETVGVSKVESAKAMLKRLNSDITIRTYDTRLDSSNVMEIFRDYDLVVDGTDNFPTRYLINDACVFLGLPNVHGSIFHFDGQVTVFNAPGGGPCYRCLYPEPPPPELAPSCAEAGVLGAICGIIGTLQAAETMKLLLGAGELLAGRVLSIDVLRGTVRELKTRKDPHCPVCSANPTITELIDYEEFCSARPGVGGHAVRVIGGVGLQPLVHRRHRRGLAGA
jgi:molybdopterin/thiamine biosynthesis adenylyltransferase